MERTERCACGGLIVAASPDLVMDSVRCHNLTPLHRAWRRRREAVIAAAIFRAGLRADVAAIRRQRELAQ